MINLLAAATSTPDHALKTSELVSALRRKLSPELINSINAQGVERRYSTLENYPEFLSGKLPHPTSSTTQLAVNATRKRVAMVLMAESHTPYVAPLLRKEYYDFRELLRTRKDLNFNANFFEQQRLDTTSVIQSALF